MEKSHGNSAKLTAAAMVFVAFVDSFSYAMILPLLPAIILGVGGEAVSGGLLVSVHALCAMLTAPLLGRLSDRFGRRRIIVLTLVGAAASYVLFAFAATLAALFIARAVAGAMAGNIGVVQAALAERTGWQARGKAMGMLTAAWAMGLVVGPAVSAVLMISDQPTRIPGLIAAGASIVSLLTVLVLFRDIAAGKSRVTDSEAGADDALRAARSTRGEIFVAIALMAMCQSGLVVVTGFFVNAELGWESREIGILMLSIALAIVLVQLAAIPILLRALQEGRTMLIGLAAAAFGAAIFAFSQPTLALVALAAPALFCGITIVQTALMTRLSNSVGTELQGTVMGASNGWSAFGRIVGPAGFAALLTLCGAPVTFGLALLVSAAMAVRVAFRHVRNARAAP